MMFPGFQSRASRGRKRIAELEAELAIHSKAAEFFGDVMPQRRYEAVTVMAAVGA